MVSYFGEQLAYSTGGVQVDIFSSLTFYVFFLGLWLALVSNYLNTIKARGQIADSNTLLTTLGVLMWPSAISLFVFGVVVYTWWAVILGVILMALVAPVATLGSRLQRLEWLLAIQPVLDLAVIASGVCVWLLPK